MTKDYIALNPHYDFDRDANKLAIAKAEAYDIAYSTKDLNALDTFEREALNGHESYNTGITVNSPWGGNKIIAANLNLPEQNEDFVKKEITVQSGKMLSLQRHRGRDEKWTIISGKLKVILNGRIINMEAGDQIHLPKGSTHCIINIYDAPVTIIEEQQGFCREADNVRLLDCNGRSTVPLKDKTEALSAILYTTMQQKLNKKFGYSAEIEEKFISGDYRSMVNSL